MIVIALTGPQGVGKTTLMNEVAKVLSERHKVQVGYITNGNKSISREAFDFGFNINEKTSFDTQYYIALKYLAADLATRKFASKNEMRFIIYDRSVLDVIPYTNASENIGIEYKKFVESMIVKHVQKYPVNKLVFVESLDDLVKDQYRSSSKEFQQDINYEFLEMIQGYTFYKMPKCTVSERVDKMMSIIFDDGNEL